MPHRADVRGIEAAYRRMTARKAACHAMMVLLLLKCAWLPCLGASGGRHSTAVISVARIIESSRRAALVASSSIMHLFRPAARASTTAAHRRMCVASDFEALLLTPIDPLLGEASYLIAHR